MDENTSNNLPKVSPAPNWTSIFSLRPELDPPGYAEALIYVTENPRIKLSEIKKEETKKKRKKSGLGRNERA
jgi:hypothetical protein